MDKNYYVQIQFSTGPFWSQEPGFFDSIAEARQYLYDNYRAFPAIIVDRDTDEIVDAFNVKYKEIK